MATSLPAGTKLHAKYTDGNFYVAEVVEWTKKKKNPIKVHYLGYDKSEDAWVSREDVRSKQLEALPKEDKAPAKEKKGKSPKKEKAAAPAKEEPSSELPEVGAKLKAKFTDGKMYGAEVLQVSTAKKRSKAPVKVHYTGYGEDEDMWVALDDLQMPKKKGKKAAAAAPAAKEPAAKADMPIPTAGTRLQATFAADGKFYVAEVLEVGVKVHYLGYGADEDAWVPLSKVKSKALKDKKKK
jgi:hypothetical protein